MKTAARGSAELSACNFGLLQMADDTALNTNRIVGSTSTACLHTSTSTFHQRPITLADTPSTGHLRCPAPLATLSELAPAPQAGVVYPHTMFLIGSAPSTTGGRLRGAATGPWQRPPQGRQCQSHSETGAEEMKLA